MIKNIVFDLGNVIVRWAPYEVLQKILPEYDPKELYAKMRPIWLDLNLGKLTEGEAIELYNKQFGIDSDELKAVMHEFKISQTFLPGSLELLKKLHDARIPLYSITDNIREIMEHHEKNSGFLQYFEGIVVSADLGVLKPDPLIYKYLLDKYNLNPAECVFIDDVEQNVNGAISVGMNGFQFTDIISCEQQLMASGVI